MADPGCLIFQWRVQDFPEGNTNSRRGCANLLFFKIVAENCMKMKEFRQRGGILVPGAYLRSTTAFVSQYLTNFSRRSILIFFFPFHKSFIHRQQHPPPIFFGPPSLKTWSTQFAKYNLGRINGSLNKERLTGRSALNGNVHHGVKYRKRAGSHLEQDNQLTGVDVECDIGFFNFKVGI